MILEHNGKSPVVAESAYVAPTATLCGDIRVRERARILFGAVLSAEGGTIEIGEKCIVMENAVLRGTKRHPLILGSNVLVGPRAYLTGCTIEDEVFLATGSTVFNGAKICARSEVRINGVVHLRTTLPPETTVPIAWVAVGDPPVIRPPEDHDAIWKVQETLDFPKTVFGLERPAPGRSKMPQLAERYARALGSHKEDRIIDRSELGTS